MLVYGFDTSGTDVEELKGGVFDNSQPGNAKREAYLESGALAKFPHILFLVVSDETPRARQGSWISVLLGHWTKTLFGLRLGSRDYLVKCAVYTLLNG